MGSVVHSRVSVQRIALYEFENTKKPWVNAWGFLLGGLGGDCLLEFDRLQDSIPNQSVRGSALFGCGLLQCGKLGIIPFRGLKIRQHSHLYIWCPICLALP
jgi:hypothetical protein